MMTWVKFLGKMDIFILNNLYVLLSMYLSIYLSMFVTVKIGTGTHIFENN